MKLYNQGDKTFETDFSLSSYRLWGYFLFSPCSCLTRTNKRWEVRDLRKSRQPDSDWRVRLFCMYNTYQLIYSSIRNVLPNTKVTILLRAIQKYSNFPNSPNSPRREQVEKEYSINIPFKFFQLFMEFFNKKKN